MLDEPFYHTVPVRPCPPLGSSSLLGIYYKRLRKWLLLTGGAIGVETLPPTDLLRSVNFHPIHQS